MRVWVFVTEININNIINSDNQPGYSTFPKTLKMHTIGEGETFWEADYWATKCMF